MIIGKKSRKTVDMKLALINLPIDINVGGNLQRYAVCRTLHNIGIDVTHIQLRFHYHIPMWKKPYVYTKRLLLKILLGRNIEIFNESKQNKLYLESLNQILPFYDKYVHHTDTVYDVKKLNKIISDFDAVLVGSDQVWRKKIANRYLRTMLLDFIPDTMPCFAYAVSFGGAENEFTSKDVKMFQSLYGKFKMVSVREKSGIDMLAKLECTNPQAIHLLDPTFLVPKSEYEIIASRARSKCTLDGDMFCYILDKNENKSRKIEQLAEEKGLTPFGMTLDSNVNIEQWLLSYSKAKYIVTDSYHGMVFALIFNKPFYVFENKFRGNERFKSIQESFGITNNEDNPDWGYINDIIRIESEKSYNYLEGILKYNN